MQKDQRPREGLSHLDEVIGGMENGAKRDRQKADRLVPLTPEQPPEPDVIQQPVPEPESDLPSGDDLPER